MAAETSSATNQRLSLDHPSFEKLLAAAWVLQCLHDQLHNPQVSCAETIAEAPKIPAEKERPVLRVVLNPVVQPTPRVKEADSKQVLSTCRARDESISKLLDAQPAVETRTLHSDAVAKVELRRAEPERHLRSEDVATAQVSKPPHPDLQKPIIDDGSKLRRRAVLSLQPARLRTANLRAALRHALQVLPSLRPSFRVKLTLRALRTVAIATPVLLLVLVASLLLVETWRHESFHSAQAISRTSTVVAEPVQSGTAITPATTTLTTTTRAVSYDNKKVTKSKPIAKSPSPTTHRQVTDKATLSVVQALSQYEIGGLRRQAKYGDAAAAFALGMAYEIGQHVPQSCEQAARWVTTAAEAGDAAAQYNLGLRYLDGDGVPANRAQSKKWLRRAAHRNQQAKLALRVLASR